MFKGFSIATSPIIQICVVCQVKNRRMRTRYFMQTEDVVLRSCQKGRQLTGRISVFTVTCVLAWKCDELERCGNRRIKIHNDSPVSILL